MNYHFIGQSESVEENFAISATLVKKIMEESRFQRKTTQLCNLSLGKKI